MPNIQSAKKRLKTSEKARQRNRVVKGSIATTRRKLIEAIAAGDRELSGSLYKTYSSSLDKAVKKGTVTKNAAGRRKSRIVAKIAAM